MNLLFLMRNADLLPNMITKSETNNSTENEFLKCKNYKIETK